MTYTNFSFPEHLSKYHLCPQYARKSIAASWASFWWASFPRGWSATIDRCSKA